MFFNAGVAVCHGANAPPSWHSKRKKLDAPQKKRPAFKPKRLRERPQKKRPLVRRQNKLPRNVLRKKPRPVRRRNVPHPVRHKIAFLHFDPQQALISAEARLQLAFEFFPRHAVIDMDKAVSSP